MKSSSSKEIFSLAAAMLVLLASYLFVLRMEPEQSIDMARLVPNTAIVYFEQRNIVESLNNFLDSPPGKTLQTIDFAAVAKETGAGEEAISIINNLTIFLNTAQDDPLFQEMFGKRFAIAVLPPLDNTELSQKPIDFLRENIVILAEPPYPAKVLDMLRPAIFGLSTASSYSSAQYGRHRIQRFVNNATSIALTQLDKYFVVGLNERQIRRCIDTYDGELASFANNTDLHNLKKHFTHPDRLLTISGEYAREYLSPLIADMPFLIEKMAATNGIMGFTYGAKIHKSTVKEQIAIRFDREDGNQFKEKQGTFRAIQPSRFSLTTENPMLYFWSNTVTLQNLLHSPQLREVSPASAPDLSTQNHPPSQDSRADFSTMLGEDITIISETGANNSPLRIPLVMAFIPVIKKEALKDSLQELIEQHGIPTKSGEYGAAEYSFWSQAPQDGLFFLYGFWKEFFFFGNSQTLLQKIIDTHNQGFSLQNKELVKKLDPGITEENHTVAYGNNVQLIDLLKDISSFIGTVGALENRDLAKKAQIVNRKIFTPLLESTKMYDTSVLRSYFTTNTLIVDITTNKTNPK